MKISSILLATITTIISTQAYSETTNTNLLVNSNIEKSCKIKVSNVSFGTYQPNNPAISQAEGNIQIICNRLASFKLGVDRFPDNAPYFFNVNSPLAFSDNRSALAMLNTLNPATAPMETKSNNALIFQLYTDASRSIVWTGLTNHYLNYNDTYRILGVGTGATVNIPFYASLDKNQYVTPGNYVATMSLNVQF